jgi:C4-dicarboxylate-specific signal transduction histidine kinase
VVILSGRADEGLALEAVRRGAQDYLVKGHVGPDTLARAVRYAIERNRIEAELAAQRKTVEHMSRLSALGEMAATFAHELNQPLSAILLSAEEARSVVDRYCGMEAVKLREPLTVVSTQARRAAEIIRRIRGFAARSHSGPALVDVGQLVQDSCGLMQPELAHRRVRLTVDAPAGLASVQGDPLQLRQVLVNLIMNALEAMERTPAAHREVKVSARATPTGVEVSVHDHGHGVTAENLPSMMEPFFTTKREGLGLGLSISRSIIESHSGRLSAEANTDGPGMTFRFVLPRDRGGNP